MDENTVRSRMQQVIDLVANDIGSIRTGRATPALVEGLAIPVYGGTQKLKVVELATITATDPVSLVIDPWDKSIVGEIRQGILAANVGMNPNIDGEIIRISFPPLTSEDREKYVKLLSTKLEAGRVMIRQVRHAAKEEIEVKEKEKEISESEKFEQEKRLQEITDEFVGKIDEIGEKKKEELMSL